MYFDAAFQSGNYPFPSADINTNLKRNDPNYSLDNLKAIYAYGLRDPHGAYINRDRIALNRLYGAGNQPIEPYMDIIDPLQPVMAERDNGKGGKERYATGQFARRGYGNIDWTIDPILVKFRSTFIGMFANIEHFIELEATDEASSNLKKSKKAELEIKMRFKDQIHSVLKYAGIDVEGEYIPQTQEELEAYFEMGIDKLDYEIAMEGVVGDAFGQSDWNDIRDKINGDFFDSHESSTYDDFNPNTLRMETYYADPEQVIIEHVQNRNYKDSTFAGVVLDYTIQKLRLETGWPEEKVRKLAQTFANSFGNKTDISLNEYQYYEEHGNCNYNDFHIPVLLGRWKTIDYEFGQVGDLIDVEITNKTSIKDTEIKKGRIVKEGDKYFKKNVISDRDYVKRDTGVEMTYEAKFVIGTDYVWGYGLMPYQERDFKQTGLGIRKYTCQGKSPCERAQPTVDNWQLNWLKYQKNLADAPGKLRVYDYESLIATAKEMNHSAPLELMAIAAKGSGGIALKWSTHNVHTMQGNQSNAHPLYDLEGGIGAQLEEHMRIFEMDLKKIEDVTGMANVATGNAGKEQAVGVSDMLLASTNNVLKPIYEAYKRLKVSTATSIVLRAQPAIVYDEDIRNSYEKVIGKTGIESIVNAAKENNNPITWGIVIVAMPSQEEKDKIEARLQQAMAVGRNGVPLLNIGSVFHISRMLSTPNGLKSIERFCTIQEMRKEFITKKDKQDDMKLQGQINQENAIAVEKAKQETGTMQMQNNVKEYYFKAIIDTEIKDKSQLVNDLIKNGIQINADKEAQQNNQQAQPGAASSPDMSQPQGQDGGQPQPEQEQSEPEQQGQPEGQPQS